MTKKGRKTTTVQRHNLRLKHAFVDSRLTQRAVAEKAKLPEYRVSLILRGLYPTEEERAAIAKALGRPEADLFDIPTEPFAQRA